MVKAHTNTTLNSSKKKKKKKDKETKKLWGLKQNKKAPNVWHEDKRLWVGVYKIVEVWEVKMASGNMKSLCFVREENLETMNSRK